MGGGAGSRAGRQREDLASDLMQRVQALVRTSRPATTTRAGWMFGRNRRRVLRLE